MPDRRFGNWRIQILCSQHGAGWRARAIVTSDNCSSVIGWTILTDSRHYPSRREASVRAYQLGKTWIEQAGGGP